MAPKPKAKLSVSFWPIPKSENLTETYVSADGSLVTFSFSVINRSNVYAKDAVLWLQICDGCKFHKEPALSQHAPGAPDTERMFKNIDLPPGVQVQQLTAELEIPTPYIRTVIVLSYQCPDCEVESENQQLSITIGRTIPRFLQPPQVTKPKKKVR